MRRTIGLTATLAALAIAGCGGQQAEREASTAPETPASYDAIAASRARGRDEEPVTPGGVEVQIAYDRQRADERAAGRIGTVGESQRAGMPTGGAQSSNSDPSRGGFPGTTTGGFGGTSAGSEAPRAPAGEPIGGTQGSPGVSTGSPTGGDRPIPYAGSRTIEAAYPGIPSAGGHPPPAAPRYRPPPEQSADHGYFGIPAHPYSGSRAMPQSNAGATIQGPEGPATGPTTPPEHPYGQGSSY